MPEERVEPAAATGKVFTDVRAWMAAVILLVDRGDLPNASITLGEDEDTQRFAAEVRELNPDWQPGQVPRLPPGGPTGLPTAERERRIRLHGDWAHWPSGELKADWLLMLGPKAWEKRQRRNMQALLRDRAKLAKWRREGYTFDAEHRLVAPAAVATPERRENATTREPRPRRRVKTAARGDPDEPPLAEIPPARFRRAVDAWLGAA